MKISYQRGIRHNYMIIDPEELVWEGYESRMLSTNLIEGLLHLQIRQQETGVQLLYEITSRQPLSRLLEGRKIQAEEIRKLVSGVFRVLERMEGYLLGESHILLEPDHLYVEPEGFQVWLCLVPGLERDFPEDFGKFLEYLLECVDHEDKESVVLAYGLYQETRKENYGTEDLLRLLCKNQGTDPPGSRGEQKIQNRKWPELPGTAGAVGNFPAEKPLEKAPAKDKVKGLPKENGPLARLRLWFREHFLHTKEQPPVQVPWEMMFREDVEREAWGDSPENLNSQGQNLIGLNPMGQRGAEPGGKWENRRSLTQEAPRESEASLGQIPEFGTALLADLSDQNGSRRLRALDSGNEDIVISYYPFVIGKQSNLVDYQLKQDTVSRLHVRIDQGENGYQIQDLNSTNGTYLKGRLLENNEAAELDTGDEIRIANYRYRFE